MKIIQLIVILIPLLFLSCKKDPPIEPETAEPVMPPLTHQGLNTFGCYIDGELFVANDGDNYWDIPAVSGSFDSDTKKLIIQGTRNPINETDKSDDIIIRAFITDSEGEYLYTYNEDHGSQGYVDWGGCDYYYESIEGFDLGKLTVTYFNKDDNIIAGRFKINLVNENCEGDTLLKITDGRFDFHY